jgi:hypothetical protein
VKEGHWAWATPQTGGANTVYCLLETSGLYLTDLCNSDNGTGSFEAWLRVGQGFPLLLALIHKSTLTSKIAGVALQILCTHGHSAFQPESVGLAGHGAIIYTGCSADKLEKCTVGSKKKVGEIETEPLMSTNPSPTDVVFSSETEETFVTIEFSGTECSVKGTNAPITGTQLCTYESSIESPAELHDLNCKGTGSKLKLGANAAEYEGLNLLFFDGEPLWKIQ